MSQFRIGAAPFSIALARLFPITDRAKILALFEHQVTWKAISDWRAGKCEAPQWAMDKIACAIEARIAPLAESLAAVRNAPPRKHDTLAFRRQRHLALIGWRARQELEKEKAPD